MQYILALESSGLVASAALVTRDILAAETTMCYDSFHNKTHSETLLPMADRLLTETGIVKEDIIAIAYADGPGSFTGLRIGAATALGLAASWDAPLIAVPTLACLAYNCCGSEAVVVPLMDARRSQVYAAAYIFKGLEMRQLIAADTYSIEEITQSATRTAVETGKHVMFTGDGIEAYRGNLEACRCESGEAIRECGVYFAPPHMRRQRAGTLGALAWQHLDAGRQSSADNMHSPQYLRRPQAERERQKGMVNAL